MSAHEKTGLLLVNLGSPSAPTTAAVRTYLREFLSDPRVLDMPAAARWLLLNAIILPFRSPKSAHAYASIWTEQGSPLISHTADLSHKVAALLPNWQVAHAMRYGEPALVGALEQLLKAGCTRLIVFPLYPQYASSSTGTALDTVFSWAAQRWNTPSLASIGPFYQHPAFISAFAAVAKPQLEAFRPDFTVFSYHGLPVRHVKKSGCTGDCKSPTPACCETITPANEMCYRAHCVATTKALVPELGLAGDSYRISFQSRLGRDPWLAPNSSEVFAELARAGKRNVAVLCPAFVADCLETLEEIAIRENEAFRAAGGECLRLITSLNSEDIWAQAVAQIATEFVGVPVLASR